ncbi:hypothetical protein HK100_006975, partial [Physocladia obscura]
MNFVPNYPTASAATVEAAAAAILAEYSAKSTLAHQYTIAETLKNTAKNSASANTHRLAGIAITVMGILTRLAANSGNNDNNSNSSSNNAAFGETPSSPRNRDQYQHDASLRRLVAVFVGCSARASPGRQQALPTTVVTALLLVHRIVRKVIETNNSSNSTNNNSDNRRSVPQTVLDIVHSPVDLFLAALILAESSLSDSQTSTTSWARLYDQSGIVTSEGRKRVANLKWTIFEWLDYSIDISRDTFMRWCGVIRRWIGEYPSAAISGATKQTTGTASYSTMQHSNSMFVPSIESVETPITSPTTPVSPEIPSSSASTVPSFVGGIHVHANGMISFDPKPPTTTTTTTTTMTAANNNNLSVSASAPFNLSFSLNPPQFSLSCRTLAANTGANRGSSLSSLSSASYSWMKNESVIAANTAVYRTHPYQRSTNSIRLSAHQH